ncbi:MAG: Uma2 family endonuclease, partial [Cyanobacteria bacterium J06598_3]
MTLEEYVSYDDGTGSHRYELWDGMLVDMGAESDINVVIGTFLIVVFSQLVPYQRIRRGTEVEVKGNLANTRFP